MLDNSDQLTQGQDNLMGTPIVEGTPVYDAGGDKVGDVARHDVQGGYLDVKKGWLFPKDVYIPMGAIARKTTDGVYLSMYKDQLKEQNWDNPPQQGQSWSGSVGHDVGNTVERGRTDVDMNRVNADTANLANQDTIDMPVVDEELQARKQREELGRVHLHKDVTEEQETLNVPVTHEEVTVERVPVQGAGNISDDAFQEKDIDVPVMGEQVTAEKRAQTTEEVRLHKQAVTENQPITDTVRKERVEVEGIDDQGNVPLDRTDDDLRGNNPRVP